MSKNNSFAARFGKKPISEDVSKKNDENLDSDLKNIKDASSVEDTEYSATESFSAEDVDNSEDSGAESLSTKDDAESELVNTDSGVKSFADRFAKKSTFSAEKSLGNEAENKKIDFSNVDPKKRAQADLIYLVKGIDDNRNAWYYVLVERPKVQLFLKALNDDIIHLENYGIILYSAYGDEPPQDITDAVNKEYGIR